MISARRILPFALTVGLLALSLAGPTTYAQSAPTSPPLWPRPGAALHVAHLTSDDGLAQNSVEDILQDRQGFIWIGTVGGLSRFDGYRFTTYRNDPDNLNSLSNNWVRDLYEDSDGMLWIGTEGGGVNKFDPRTETFTRYLPDRNNPNSIAGDRVFNIFQDSAGQFWFTGVGLTGVNRFDPTTQTFTRYPSAVQDPAVPNPFQGGAVWEIIEDEAGSLWMAAERLVAKYDLRTETFSYYQLPAVEGGPETHLDVMHQDAAGFLWTGGNTGLYRLDPQSGVFTHYPLPAIRDLVEDEAGNLWLASLGGLVVFDPRAGQVIHHYRRDPTQIDSLNNNRLTALYRDRAGVLWIGTEEGGVNVYDPRQAHFAHYRHGPDESASLAEGTVNTISPAGEGRLWVGTGDVVNLVDLASGQVTHYTPEDPATIRAVYQDRAGVVWVGVAGGLRLYRLNPATGAFTPFPLASPSQPAGPGQSSIVDIEEDAQGALWVATDRSGVFRLDPERDEVHVYETPASVAPLGAEAPPSQGGGPPPGAIRPPVNDIFVDRAGGVWVSTLNGLSRLDPNTGNYRPYRAQASPSGPDSFMESALEDRNGLIWVASRDGLIRIDPQLHPKPEAVKYYTEKEGLPTAHIVSILEDETGDLWLSTKKGLARFTPATETFRNYAAADGLQGNEFSAQAFGQTSDGQMFFGGVNGLTAFYPEHISDNVYQAPVILTDFQLFNQPVTPSPNSPLARPIWNTQQLTLNYDQNFIAFEFATLSYAAPQKNLYRYKLDGLEENWIETNSQRRFVSYPNLPAGNYTFRVQGANSDGIWSGHEVALTLTIQPPWWETLWFRGAALLLLIGAVVGGVRWRLYSIEQRNRDLERQVAERTRELRESEAQLRRAKDTAEDAQAVAEAANRAKSIFLANMSHELRSPLNAILGFAQITGRQPHLPAEAQENLDIIERSGEHLLGLINQVLDLSKIEAGRMLLNENDFDVYRLLEEVEDMFRLKADDKRLRLLVERSESLPHYIRTDEIKVRQVLINLINNAIKFTETGGISVRVKPVEADARITALQFEVEDSGVGIAPDEMDHLFEAFVQTSAGRQAQEGTGLGLPLSRKFVQLMGGDITVKSEVGHGSVFTFTLQARVVSAPLEPKLVRGRRAVGLEPGQPHYRILVVDDNHLNRQLLVKLLTPFGFELREAENGQRAIDLWQTFEPQLIWMDMRMPVMDGFEATRTIKATAHGQATVIIALTASSFEEERAIVLAAGCDDFVRKPFREEEIFEMLTKHLGVRFVYEPPEIAVATPVTTPAQVEADLHALPAELRTRLREGIELGDLEVIDTALAAIRPHRPALADELARLAHRFEYDRLLNLLR